MQISLAFDEIAFLFHGLLHSVEAQIRKDVMTIDEDAKLVAECDGI
tara:strand:+ start:315 stop:452 length:138 start_codon:yes stop_codon:yes gene_type:complete